MKITDELFIKDQPDEEFINGIHLEWTGTLPFTHCIWKNYLPHSRFLGEFRF